MKLIPLVVASLFSIAASATEQILTVSPTEIIVGAEDTQVSFDVQYATDPENAQTTGLDFELYYDSSVLQFVSLTPNSDVSGRATPAGYGLNDDQSNGDEDSSTDKTIVSGYFDTGAEWPELQFIKEGAIVNLTFPVSLYTVVFAKVDPNFEGTTTLNFAASPGPGNTVTAESFSILFKGDETPPVISLADDVTSFTIEAQGPTTSSESAVFDVVEQAISVSDNKDTLTVDDVIFSSEQGGDDEELFFPAGTTTTVYLRVLDSSGNADSAEISITVVDTTIPTFTGVGDVTLAANDAAGLDSDASSVQAYLSLISATDTVSGDLSASIVNNLPTTLPIGDTVVVFSVTDAAGNPAEAQATVTVADLTAPVISSTSSVEGNAEGGFEWSASAVGQFIGVTDNVDASPTISLASSTPAVLPVGENLISVTATDASSNQSEQSVLVTVTDTTKPVITGDNLELEGSPGLAVPLGDDAVQNWLATITATDIVDGAVDVSNNAPDEFPFGVSTSVVFTATDSAGNQATATFSLAVSPDEYAPEITAPSSITVEATGAEGALASNASIAAYLAGATATDNVDGDISSSVTSDAPDIFALGTTVVTFSVKDSSNNQASSESSVEVVDTTAPVFSGVVDVTFAAVDATGTPSSALEEFGATITATDVVDGNVEVSDDVPETFPLGDTVVTLTAIDSAGNTASASLTVTIADQTNPLVAAADLSIEATGAEGANVSSETLLGQVTASDNVDDPPTVNLSLEGGVFGFGETQVTATVTDAAGNSSATTFTVTVDDTTAPAFEGLRNLVLTVVEEQPVPSSDERFIEWLDGVKAVDLVDGEVVFSTSEVPDEFPVGETSLTFTASDTRSNEVSQIVTVRVAVGPAVNVPDDVTIVSLDGEGVAATQSNLAAFLSAATAEDFSGNALDVTNDAPEVFSIGSTLVTFSAVDAEGLEGFNTASATIIVASAENDTDADGIDDLFEVENGLNPNDQSDGEADSDGDGRKNLDEYLEGKDPNADDVEPVVTAPTDIFADSTGLFTSIDLGSASAIDTLDGDLSASPDNSGPFQSGSYEIIWTATDAAGNSGIDTQSLVIRPLVTVAAKGRAAEGATFNLSIALNGEAPDYPVQIPVILGGTATRGVDYEPLNLGDGDVFELSEGTSASIALSILEDDFADEGVETIVVSLGNPLANAVLGAVTSAQLSIVEEAVPPALKISLSQGDSRGRTLSTGGGEVTATLDIVDPNGEHTVDWSASSSEVVDVAVISGVEAGQSTIKFDPSSFGEGSLELVAQVTDSGIEGSTFRTSVVVKISQAEVEADSDGDGIPDSKDTSDKANVIALDANSSSAAASSEEGTKIVIGDTANDTGTAGIGITEEALSNKDNGEDEDFNYPSGILDFEVQDLPIPGESVRIVIPLPSPVPEEASFRKYTEESGWYDFVVDERNSFATALGSLGACPDIGSDEYSEGLTIGDNCLQLTLQDGGPNDADGEVNGVFKDPSGIAEKAPVKVVIPPNTTNQKRVGGGGGCSVASGPSDFGLLILLVLASLGWFRQRLAVFRGLR